MARTASPGNLQAAVANLTNYDHTVVKANTDGVASADGNGNGSVNGLLFGDLSLVFVAYAAHVRVFAPPTRDQVVLVIPLGPMGVEVAGRREVMTVPFLLSASADSVMFPDPIAGSLVGSTQLSHLTAQLRDVFGDDREFTIDLTDQRPIPVSSGMALRRTWLEFASAPQSESQYESQYQSPSESQPRAQSAVETEPTRPLIDSMLVGLAPYTRYRNEPLASAATPPNYLVHATQYMHNHLSEPISLASVAELTGISARQLQLAFRAHLGCTAQEFLKRIRLERAHRLLTNAEGSRSKSVLEVSAEVGIPHPSRFAQYFSERFGVLPSTLVNEIDIDR